VNPFAAYARRKIDVENFPAFVVVDNKGNDFFAKWQV
jgi:fumarate hydratase class I